jgi:hypothetical protein
VAAPRVPAQLTRWLVAVALCGCGKAQLPAIPPSVDAWGRILLATDEKVVCLEAHGSFCRVNEALVPHEIRALGMRTIWLQGIGTTERYIDLDWGGGHVDAYGVVIGPAGWAPPVDAERGEKRIRAGVFSYDMRQ